MKLTLSWMYIEYTHRTLHSSIWNKNSWGNIKKRRGDVLVVGYANVIKVTLHIIALMLYVVYMYIYVGYKSLKNVNVFLSFIHLQSHKVYFSIDNNFITSINIHLLHKIKKTFQVIVLLSLTRLNSTNDLVFVFIYAL